MVNISRSSGHEASFSEHVEHDHLHHPALTDSSEQLLQQTPIMISTSVSTTTKHLVKRFPGTWVICLYLLLLIAFEIINFVLYDVLHLKVLGGVDEPFALLTVLHVGVWTLTFVYDRYLHFHHHSLRKYGYLMFFTRTKELRRIPLMIFSLGNASLLLVVSFCGNHPNKGMLSLIRVFQLVASVEVLTCFITIAIYIVLITKFNAKKKLPDVYHQNIVGGFESDMYLAPEVGFRDTECLDDILEKQSEMIRYLQQHNTNLGKRIVELTQMLPKEQQTEILINSNIAPTLYPQRHV